MKGVFLGKKEMKDIGWLEGFNSPPQLLWLLTSKVNSCCEIFY